MKYKIDLRISQDYGEELGRACFDVQALEFPIDIKLPDIVRHEEVMKIARETYKEIDKRNDYFKHAVTECLKHILDEVDKKNDVYGSIINILTKRAEVWERINGDQP